MGVRDEKPARIRTQPRSGQRRPQAERFAEKQPTHQGGTGRHQVKHAGDVCRFALPQEPVEHGPGQARQTEQLPADCENNKSGLGASLSGRQVDGCMYHAPLMEPR